jgi:hypothetical protein
LFLRILDLHVLVLSGHLAVHMMHRIQLLLKEQSKLHLFLVLLEVLLVFLHDLLSPFLFLLFGTCQLITLLSKLSCICLVLRLTDLEPLDLLLELGYQLVNLDLMLFFN